MPAASLKDAALTWLKWLSQIGSGWISADIIVEVCEVVWDPLSKNKKTILTSLDGSFKNNVQLQKLHQTIVSPFLSFAGSAVCFSSRRRMGKFAVIEIENWLALDQDVVKPMISTWVGVEQEEWVVGGWTTSSGWHGFLRRLLTLMINRTCFYAQMCCTTWCFLQSWVLHLGGEEWHMMVDG